MSEVPPFPVLLEEREKLMALSAALCQRRADLKAGHYLEIDRAKVALATSRLLLQARVLRQHDAFRSTFPVLPPQNPADVSRGGG